MLSYVIVRTSFLLQHVTFEISSELYEILYSQISTDNEVELLDALFDQLVQQGLLPAEEEEVEALQIGISLHC